MDKYKKLFSNTVIFAIGTFSSKVLVFLLMPLYTWALSPDEYAVTDLIVQSGNLLLPLVSLGIVNSIIRFGLDKSVRKSDVFTSGLITVACGFGGLILLSPLLSMIDIFSGNILLVYIFTLTSTLRSLCSQFVRARGMVRLFAFDGVLSTITTILFNVLFLVVFKFGVIGYVMAIVCSDLLSSVFLFFVASLHRFVQIKTFNKKIWKEMLIYALPLIPNTICWWITNVSDRFIVTYMLGHHMDGLYAVSYKLPTIITLFSSIFMSAWQISAITEENGRSKFFTQIFRSYSSLIFMAGAAIIPFSKILVMLFAQPSYYDAWQFIPFLVMATVFNCFGTFLGSVFAVEKKSILMFLTISGGAALNVALNFLLIPLWGVNGAAFATFASYVLVFILRFIGTRRYIKIQIPLFQFLSNIVVLLGMALIMIFEIPGWIVFEALLLIALLALNLRDLLQTAMKLLKRK